MKHLFITLAFAASMLFQAQTNQPTVDTKYPVIKFEEPKIDFGTLHEGDVVTHVYKFKNTGDAPLIISRIKASCGCTVPSNWKKEPIMPGENSEFTVRFNTRNKIHKQHKTVTIYCNTKNKTERVYFTANVIPDPKMEKQRAERRKRWMERRKLQNAKKGVKKKVFKKKLNFAEQDQVESHKIDIKKLEWTKLKLEQKLKRYEHKHKANGSAKKIKRYKDKIEKLEQQIQKKRKAIELLYKK